MRMFKTKCFAVAVAGVLGAVAVWAQNPISPMGVYIADPSARVAPDGRLYIYGSLDESPQYYCSGRYNVLSTKNLRKWRLDLDTFTLDNFKFEDGTHFYAPDAAYKGGKTYLYVCTNKSKEYVAIGDSPSGPFPEVHEIECPGQIDPAIFVDDDGQGYFFYSQFSSRVAKLNPDMVTLDLGSMVEGTVDEANHAFHEGSFVFKRGKYYYYVYADISRNHRPTCIGYSMATSLLGPYTYKGVIVDNAGCDPEVWNNHGSVVKYKGRWYVLYHRATHGCVAMRKTCIEPIKFNPDGTIDEVEMTTQGAGKPLKAFEDIDAARACRMSGHVRIEEKGDTPGREVLSQIVYGDSAVWKYLKFRKKDRTVTVRVNAPAGATISLYVDGIDGNPIAKIAVPAAEGWQEVTAPVKETGGVHALWATFGAPVATEFQLDLLRFSK